MANEMNVSLTERIKIPLEKKNNIKTPTMNETNYITFNTNSMTQKNNYKNLYICILWHGK